MARMSRRAAAFRQVDITRAARGAVRAGLPVSRVEIDQTGKIVVICQSEQGEGASPAPNLDALRRARMGWVNIPYLVVKHGRAYWQPTKAMRRKGARALSLGPDGPAARAKADAAYQNWLKRSDEDPAPRVKPGTLAAAFADYRATEEWRLKAERTREEWWRAWSLIGPMFGDCRPARVTLADISAFRLEVERNVSLREAHRAIKIWRALWQKAAALKYCKKDEDPSFGVRNREAAPRQASWEHGEAVRLAKGAWRAGYKGLAAAIAVAWDTSLSPVDVRGLRPQDRQGDAFSVACAKTGRAAIGTLSPRSLRLLDDIADLPQPVRPRLFQRHARRRLSRCARDRVRRG